MKVTLDGGDLWGLAAATTAAIESGLLLAMMQQDSASCLDLASGLELDADACERVLDVLVAAGVSQRRGDGYGLSLELIEAHRGFPGGLAIPLSMFREVPSYLRAGQSFGAMDGDLEDRGASYRNTVTGLARLFEDAARSFAQSFPGRPGSILDVGCGSGIWSLTLAEQNPESRVSGLDLPEVLPNFVALAAERGLSDRIETLPGDMHEVRVAPASFDAILLANVVRLESADRTRALIERLAQGLRPGGQLIVLDALAGGTSEREISRAVYQLNLALRTKDAGVHSPATIETFLTDAGLENIQALDFGVHPGAVAAIYGARPE